MAPEPAALPQFGHRTAGQVYTGNCLVSWLTSPLACPHCVYFLGQNWTQAKLDQVGTGVDWEVSALWGWAKLGLAAVPGSSVVF